MEKRYRFGGGSAPLAPPTVSLSRLASRSLVESLLVIAGIELNPGPSQNTPMSLAAAFRALKLIPPETVFHMKATYDSVSEPNPSQGQFKMVRHPASAHGAPLFRIMAADGREHEFPIPTSVVYAIESNCPENPVPYVMPPLSQVQLEAAGDPVYRQLMRTMAGECIRLQIASGGSSQHTEEALFEMADTSELRRSGKCTLMKVDDNTFYEYPTSLRVLQAFPPTPYIPTTNVAQSPQRDFEDDDIVELDDLGGYDNGGEVINTQELQEREREETDSPTPQAVLFTAPPGARRPETVQFQSEAPERQASPHSTTRPALPVTGAPRPPVNIVPRPLAAPPPLAPLVVDPAAFSAAGRLQPEPVLQRTWSRAVVPATPAEYKLPLPTVSFLPARLHAVWASNVTSVLQKYKEEEDADRLLTMQYLLQLPEKLLTQTKARAGSRRMAHLNRDEIANLPQPTERRQVKSKTPEEQQINRAVTLAVAGFYSRAAQAAFRDAYDRIPEEQLLLSLGAKHPQRCEEIPLCTIAFTTELKVPAPPHHIASRHADKPKEPPLKTFVRRLCRGKSGGPSGWTEELIRDAITEGTEKQWLAVFTDIANANFDTDTLRYLCRCILIGIPKGPEDNDARPLAMGEALVKVSAKLLLANQRHLTDSASVGEFQFAFQPFGVEQIIHRVRARLTSDTAAHTVLVDCSNAFNTVRRKAIYDVLMSSDRFNALRPMFNAFYVQQGELIVRCDKDIHPVIASSEGVRQGDVLGPLLFCLALRPAIERMMDAFAAKHPTLNVEVFAYMDDITLVGDEASCQAAYVLLKDALEELSLIVNPRKTVTTSATIAASIQCSLNDCPKLLGAFVSKTRGKEKEHVDLVPQEHENFFNRLPHMPAEVAFRLLTLCGVPKWAHMVRTHPNEVVTAASSSFNEMSARCLASILKVDYNAMSDEVYLQARLPVRFGGLGLHDWVSIGPGAYEASLNMERSRGEDEEFMRNAPDEANLKEDAYWEGVMKAIGDQRPEFHKHLTRNSTKMACRWLFGDISFSSAFASNHFRCALLFRLRWAPSADATTTIRCRCGFPRTQVTNTTNKDVLMHLAGCAHNGGPTKRHNQVRDALARMMRDAGYTVQVEALVADDLRMDIVCTHPDEPKLLYVDVTIANTTGRSHRGAEVAAILEKKEEEKRRRYGAAAEANGYQLVPFALDVHGKMTAASQNLIRDIVATTKKRASDAADGEPMTVGVATSILSKALAYGNGACLQLSGKLKAFGINLHKPVAPLTTSQRAQSQDGDNARHAAAQPSTNNNLPAADVQLSNTAASPEAAPPAVTTDADFDAPVRDESEFCELP